MRPRPITRRKAILMLGTTMLAGRAAAQFIPQKPACVLTPQQMQGPYFSDLRLERSDIRSDPGDGSVKPGMPLSLLLHVLAMRDGGCYPLPGAIVDIWHCDASGVYSDAVDASFDTRGKKFLRGYQVSDADGAVRFLTIYPGWYPGRAVHLHFKLRLQAAGEAATEVTSQLYFPDRLTDAVHALQPYAGAGRRRTRNEEDALFRRGGGRLMLDVTRQGQGYLGRFDIGIQVRESGSRENR